MSTLFMRRPVRLLAALALAAVLLLALLGRAGAAGAQQRVVRPGGLERFSVEVTAIRVPQPGSAPDTATLQDRRLHAFRRAPWDRLGRTLTVGQRSGWFWNVVARPYGLRSLTLARPGGRYPSPDRPPSLDLALRRPLRHLPLRRRGRGTTGGGRRLG